MKAIIQIALLAFSFAAPLAAQQTRRQPCMLMEETRQFDFWLGKWKVVATGTKTVVGHSTIAIASGGCSITEDWLGTKGEEGHSVSFFNPSAHEWEQVYVGSSNGPNRIQFYHHGTLRDGAMRFEAEVPTTTGEAIKIRFRFRNLGDRVQQIHETSTDGGAKWTTDYDFTYLREEES